MLALICLIACLLFSLIMVGGVYLNREAFLHEYAPQVQARFLSLHPGRAPKKGRGRRLLLVKLLMTALFILLLSALSLLAGARGFRQGALYAYVIWFVVNWYDVFALDMLLFARWRRLRLPGTEDMDREYRGNYKKHIMDGFFGTALGVPVALVCGWIIASL